MKFQRFMRRLAGAFGCNVMPRQPTWPDIEGSDLTLLRRVDDYTMTSIERRFHLLASIRYLSRNQVPGAIVECGVWRGGSVMLALSALIEEGIRDRDIYLYDTFEGMPDPGGEDIDAAGVSAHARLRAESSGKDSSNVWAIATLDEVRRNLSATDYPAELIHCVVGPVEATIPSTIPQQIALLRLDTDWYGSTSHELHYLYPKVVSGGVVIIDDYGYWRGARQAVDEFITRSTDPILLHRIDDTGRAFVKP